MRKKYFYKLITSVLIFSFVIPIPYLTFLKKAEAQTGTGTQNGGYSVSGGYGIGGYLDQIAPAIKQLPLCQGELSGVIQGLFRKGGAFDDYQKYLLTVGKDEKPLTKDEFKKAQAENEIARKSVSVFDNVTYMAVIEGNKKATETQKDIAKIKGNDSCFQSLGRFVTKLLLQKLTYSTVEWIQGGFKGSPAFVKNYKDYFWDIAKTDILGFGTEIDDPNLFPFGKEFIRNRALSLQNKFSDNAEYSLNKVIRGNNPQYSDKTFEGDFSQGGWEAWSAMAHDPANNPLGFTLLAANELDSRIANSESAVNKELDRGQGFLGDTRCEGQPSLTYQQNQAALVDNQKEYVTVEQPDQYGDIETVQKATGYILGTCRSNKWSYVTPGSLIADAATKALNYPDNQYLKAQDLNDAVAAILDATINHFTTNLIDQGLALLGTSGANGYFNIDNNNVLADGGYSQTSDDFPPFVLGSSWMEENPNFNIRTDLTQALIDEQRIYKEKIDEQSKVLTDLNTTIFQLDYCIPGPHPGYEQDSRRILSVAENSIVSKTPADMEGIDKDKIDGIIRTAGYVTGAAIGIAIGAGTGPLAPIAAPIGAAIGALTGLFIDIFGGPSNEKKLAAWYAYTGRTLTGIHIDPEGKDSAEMRNKQELTGGIDKLFAQYLEISRNVFTPEFLPPVAKDAAVEFGKASGNWQIIKADTDKVVLMNGVITRLGTLKDRIDQLNAQYNIVPPLTQGPEAYEASLKDIINEFGRISADMVTGNDIAEIDNSLKQAKDEIKYVYKDLLIGQFGCEKDLRDNNRPLVLPADPAKTNLVRGTRRIEYPFKIWYDYNNYGPNAQLPTPTAPQNTQLGQLLKYLDSNVPPVVPPIPGNLMPSYQMNNGPGFLSTAYFDYDNNGGDHSDNNGNPLYNDSCGGRPLNSWELACISAQEAFKSVDSWPVSVGKNGGIPGAPVNPSCHLGKTTAFNNLHVGVNGINADTVANNCQVDTSFEQLIGIY